MSGHPFVAPLNVRCIVCGVTQENHEGAAPRAVEGAAERIADLETAESAAWRAVGEGAKRIAELEALVREANVGAPTESWEAWHERARAALSRREPQ